MLSWLTDWLTGLIAETTAYESDSPHALISCLMNQCCTLKASFSADFLSSVVKIGQPITILTRINGFSWNWRWECALGMLLSCPAQETTLTHACCLYCVVGHWTAAYNPSPSTPFTKLKVAPMFNVKGQINGASRMQPFIVKAFRLWKKTTSRSTRLFLRALAKLSLILPQRSGLLSALQLPHLIEPGQNLHD